MQTLEWVTQEKLEIWERMVQSFSRSKCKLTSTRSMSSFHSQRTKVICTLVKWEAKDLAAGLIKAANKNMVPKNPDHKKEGV